MSSVTFCQNCGWSNPAGAPACERCHAPFARPAAGPVPQQAGWGQAQAPGGHYQPQYPPPPKRGMSTGAIVAIVVSVVVLGGVVLTGIVAAIAIPSLLAARAAANEAAAVGRLRELGAAESAFYSETGRFGTIDELAASSALGPGWSEGTVRDGYRISVVELGEDSFEFKAEPDPPTSGKRSFNITEDFLIRAKDGPAAPDGTSGKALGAS